MGVQSFSTHVLVYGASELVRVWNEVRLGVALWCMRGDKAWDWSVIYTYMCVRECVCGKAWDWSVILINLYMWCEVRLRVCLLFPVNTRFLGVFYEDYFSCIALVLLLLLSPFRPISCFVFCELPIWFFGLNNENGANTTLLFIYLISKSWNLV